MNFIGRFQPLAIGLEYPHDVHLSVALLGTIKLLGYNSQVITFGNNIGFWQSRLHRFAFPGFGFIIGSWRRSGGSGSFHNRVIFFQSRSSRRQRHFEANILLALRGPLDFIDKFFFSLLCPIENFLGLTFPVRNTRRVILLTDPGGGQLTTVCVAAKAWQAVNYKCNHEYKDQT
ncbi:hypothetical protein ES703_109388 [subsurface metagenome]